MKERLDILVVRANLAPSREKAKALIMAGQVLVDGEREDKPGSTFEESCAITLKKSANPFPFVSRGGAKLAKAVESFGLSLKGRTCMDVGASTGGFTDCMLQNGAKKVYAVDVGYGQLDWKLREDPRVVVMEKTNIRYLEPEGIDEAPSFASIDVSFISLAKVLPAVQALLRKDGRKDGEVAALIKPQFEAGKEKVGKKGVVRDAAVHREVIREVWSQARRLGFTVCGLDFSPIRGPEGNIEYLLHLKDGAESADHLQSAAENGPAGGAEDEESVRPREAKGAESATSGETDNVLGEETEARIRDVVDRAHGELDK